MRAAPALAGMVGTVQGRGGHERRHAEGQDEDGGEKHDPVHAISIYGESSGGARGTPEPWIDRLRVWGALAVIALHVSGFPFRAYRGVFSREWLVANLWNSGTRWAVPTYVILSGYLLLGGHRREGALPFWRRRAARIGIPLLLWATAYALWNGVTTVPGLLRVVLVTADASYHLWFLYMLAVLYAATPLIRAAQERLPRSGQAAMCAAAFAATLHVPGFPPLLRVELLPRWLELAAPYVGYFLLGGFLSRQTRGQSLSLPLLLVALSFAVTVAGTCWHVGLRHSIASRAFQDAASPNVIAMAWSLCVLARNAQGRFPGVSLQALAPAVLGVYLVHPLFIDLLWAVGLPVERFPALLGVPLVSAIVALLSVGTVLLLRRTPLLRRTV